MIRYSLELRISPCTSQEHARYHIYVVPLHEPCIGGYIKGSISQDLYTADCLTKISKSFETRYALAQANHLLTDNIPNKLKMFNELEWFTFCMSILTYIVYRSSIG